MFSYSLFALFVVTLLRAQCPEPGVQNTAAKIVLQIRQADCEGDRAALSRLYGDLAPFAKDPAISAKVRYWRGFALWRRALNGFNESADRNELERDLNMALSEFEQALAADANFVDAKAAAASCLQNLSFLHYVQKDFVPARTLMNRSLPLLQEAGASEPENPRVLWVVGASLWYTPPERGGGQAAAIATYEKGLKAARNHKSPDNDPLKPSWGEPDC